MHRTRDSITTERLQLRMWRPEDLAAFAKLHADPEVMADLGGPISLEDSRDKLLRYISMYEQFGFSRYWVEDHAGTFVGYVGICPRNSDDTIGKHNEIGWRLHVKHWGKGYAVEAARACLAEFRRAFPDEDVISYTSPTNERSQKVMARLNLTRQPSRDFVWIAPDGRNMSLLVWSAI